MRINKILDQGGRKIISATLLLYPGDRKGINYPCIYEDGILRVWIGMEYIAYPIPTWREVLMFLRRRGNWWEYR